MRAADDSRGARLAVAEVSNHSQIEGKLSGGTPIRWGYDVITATSFHFTGEKLTSDGKSWLLYLELFGRRSIP
jgi:hypothetical protein